MAAMQPLALRFQHAEDDCVGLAVIPTADNTLFTEPESLAELERCRVALFDDSRESLTASMLKGVTKQLTQDARKAPARIFRNNDHAHVIAMIKFPEPVIDNAANSSAVLHNSKRNKRPYVVDGLKALFGHAIHDPLGDFRITDDLQCHSGPPREKRYVVRFHRTEV